MYIRVLTYKLISEYIYEIAEQKVNSVNALEFSSLITDAKKDGNQLPFDCCVFGAYMNNGISNIKFLHVCIIRTDSSALQKNISKFILPHEATSQVYYIHGRSNSQMQQKIQ